MKLISYSIQFLLTFFHNKCFKQLHQSSLHSATKREMDRDRRSEILKRKKEEYAVKYEGRKIVQNPCFQN